MQLPRPSAREAASMYGTAVAVFLVILVAALQGSAPPESPFPYRIPLDPEGTLELAWNVSYAQETVHFQLLVRELRAGVLFGMSDRGEMENADLTVLWTDGDSAYFADAWSDQKGQIHLDAQQDYQLLGAQRTPQGLSLLFRRPFSTCDPRDYLIEDGTVHLVYGILERPFPSLEAIDTAGLRTGLQRVQLLKPDISVPALPADVQTMEVRAPDVLIPGQETTYWCYMTELPAGFPRHHIVMYEPIVTEGNEALVHHMEVFQCAAGFKSFPHFSGPCDSKMKPERLNYCRHVLAAWALGAKAFYYPERAGLAFGGEESSRFLRLEVHYHNPRKIEGRRDSSGIRLYYTASLRPFDAGIMELGLVYTPVMAIPPREAAFVLTGYCTDNCTQLALPPSGIHIFASQLHTHLTGRKVVTVLARDGREMTIVNRDDHYSPHFQEIRMLKKMVTVHPGDVLITSCTYNTEDRTLATVGGFGILEEMCVNYVHYYPRTELELCKSAVDAGFLQKYFRLVNSFHSGEVPTSQQASVPQQFAEVPWTSFSRDTLRALYRFAPLAMHCNKSSALRFQGEWDQQPLPRIVSQLPAPAPRCQAGPCLSPAGPAVVRIGGGRG
ncbi:dopamine beta-hydroxylase isoform X2 [Pipistrellus kuhlii]|uniref:Dopamine beta-hydroxylase n=1 Tax=Pipistrellus kuhlii TaxID=59472 RepID=A0A7J7RMA6_PIPKU|nr:dopamine beta-hydroxylase isoform X2 [Pipistrellus kuhlii]KAF6277177.1 dopamine beta-hydroxylase [Pipistrellus kuhlii]